ncbi:ankyrin repeat domain-containing protein [Tumebacillus sp. DT12]|uniref:Ankyrin repeat domain-containing protein n=1 Tax=Tumebacillus lacus TaxID=2995335 RepID=A0ABT3XAJ9_9BACL|nr:ankyrin repeat domain-containing protein [Tumebacillus lacus]MCX7571774.1 ankyrin repeat domain-containing protein [Tumebacillus lacus]
MPTEKADIFTLARFGNLETFRRTLDISEINKKSEGGSSLLHYAISASKFDIASFLINNGIDLNLTNSDEQTALHLICVNQSIYVAKELLQNKVDINIRDRFGNNAMWTAVFNCKGMNYEMVELLMTFNPDVMTKNNAGRSPLDFAMQVGNEKLIDILLKK